MATKIMRVERYLNPDYERVCIPNTQDMHLRISGDAVNIKKYITLILDCSAGMGYYKLDGAKTRFEIMKESAIRLIQKLKSSPETQICIFTYSDKARALTELLPVDGDSNKGNIAALVNAISSLSCGQNSNMGDGMRAAYLKLKALPADARKYMILMSAGEPNMFTTVSDHLYHDFETMEGNIDYLFESGAAEHVYADYQSAVCYGIEIGKLYAKEKHITFAVGINSEESYKLEAVAAACKAETTADEKHYYQVPGLKDIDSMCEGILNEIEAAIQLKLSLKQIIPAGVEAVSIPEGFKASLQADGSCELTADIDSVSLAKLNTNEGFGINTWEAIIKVRYLTEGDKKFDNIELKYVDPYGNPCTAEISDQVSIHAYLDVIAPVTECSLRGTKGDDLWYSSDVQVSLTAADEERGSGVAKTEYRFKYEAWQNYTSPFMVTNEGVTEIYFRSVDIAGNIENEKLITLYIDKTPPTTTYSFVGTNGKLNGWFCSDTKVVLIASDEPEASNSGLGKIEYRVENMPWQEYSTPILITNEGRTEIFFRAVDKVGNIEVEKSAVLYIDKTGPVLTPPKAFTYMASGDCVYIANIGTAAAEDLLSGVASITSDPINIFNAGETQVMWKAADLNGNISTDTQKVIIQTPPPTGDYSYGVIRTNTTDYKIWFIANGFMPSSLNVKYKLRGSSYIEKAMIYNDGVWECEIKGISNTVLEYSFNYMTDITHKENTCTFAYSVTDDIAINSDYTEAVLNTSNSQIKILFNTYNSACRQVELTYSINSKHNQSIMMTKNITWEAAVGTLSNGSAVKYAFTYIDGANRQYITPWYSYTHYRA